jgi:Zn-dependent peptidase ImmA (M78 family)/DNA-binding XRE family transcriptional regulator
VAAETLARKVGVSSERIAAWEAGASRPTFRQAERLAQVTHVPFGTLFLSEPPDEKIAIPDLRTAARFRPPHLDADFKDVLRDVEFKLDWYRDYRKDHGHGPLPFVGRFTPSAEPAEVAEDMRRTLGLDRADCEAASTWEDYFRLLVARAEAAGVWVMRNGVVGNNNKRPLSVGVFRGFAIKDAIAPVVFVNGRDARAAQIFTLAHELAHVWLGETGISDPFGGRFGVGRREGEIEELCNAIAAEFLVPGAECQSAWNQKIGLEANVQRLSARFRVSRIVIAIRAQELGLIDTNKFDTFYQAEQRKWAKNRDDTSVGGDYYRTVKARNGEHFLSAVLTSAMSGDLLLRNAGTLLNMTPKNLQEAYRRQQMGQL